MQDTSIKNQEDNKEQEDQTAQQQEVEIVGGIACPIDPQERLQCESCQ